MAHTALVNRTVNLQTRRDPCPESIYNTAVASPRNTQASLHPCETESRDLSKQPSSLASARSYLHKRHPYRPRIARRVDAHEILQ
eukprot:8917583-Pyramimonas_sp.AAC.1